MKTATATFRDIWAGDVACTVKPFRTKRNGQTVTRYRWHRADGLHCCSAGYISVEAAARAKAFDRRFSNVQVQA